jgi:hypothetical protein
MGQRTQRQDPPGGVRPGTVFWLHPDPEAAALWQRTDPHQVLAALDERRETEGRSKPPGEPGEGADGKE